jgi:preprotein translocase subunit YajC
MTGKEQSACLVTFIMVVTVLVMFYMFIKAAGKTQGWW